MYMCPCVRVCICVRVCVCVCVRVIYRLKQQCTRELKSDWWERKAVELQRAADRNDMKGFCNGLKEVWGLEKKGDVHLKSTDGMETFSDSKTIVASWSEHFQKLLYVSGDIDHEALDNISQRIIKTSLDEIPTMDEMARAIGALKYSKNTWRRWNSCRRLEAGRRQSVQQTAPINHQ